MARMRVHELAKELGTSSKELLAKLKDAGEFVKSASSTVESPVVTKMTELYEASKLGKWSEEAKKKAKSAAKKAASAKKTAAVKDNASSEKEAAEDRLVAENTQSGTQTSPVPTPRPDKSTKPQAPKPGPQTPTVAAQPVPAGGEPAAPEPETTAAKGTNATAKVHDKADKTEKASKDTPEGLAKPAAAAAKSGGPKPGSVKPSAAKPESAKGATKGASASAAKPADPNAPKPSNMGIPRPGNNPFATAQGMPRPGGSGGPRPRAPRPGNNPFATAQGMPRPSSGGKDSRRGRPSPSAVAESMGRSNARPAGRSGGAERADRRQGRGSGQGNYSSGPGRSGGGFGGGPAFGGPPPAGGRGSRGGRGATQGAFGRGGGRPAKGRKSKRAKKQEFEQQSAPVIGGVQVPRGDGKTEIRIRSGASLADLAEKINVNPAALVTVLFHLGEMATATQSLDEDTFMALGDELGYVVKVVSPEDEDRELLESFDIDLEAEEVDDVDKLEPRPPVVTVMGHVDHGKTKLLDAIRHTDVIGKEHGGITQHIGAYQVTLKKADKGRKITFIDTPGHEAFTAMRARGAQVTDIAILVVAADDGVMPQTVEAINHAQSANVPIVVAVNKIDKPEANPDKIRAQLAEYGVVCEEYGGDVMFVDISAKSRVGIEQLLDAVLLTADAALELNANPHAEARGVAIEANLDKGRGAVTTVLVQRGTLRVGDSIVAGSAYGRVRAMFDDWGNEITEAGPSTPVQMLGLTSVPRAGDSFLVATDDRTARQIADKREAAERAALLAKRRKRVSLENFDDALKAGQVDMLNLIIKGDVSGAVEALEDSLLKIEVSDEVGLRIIHRGVGAITQNDVNLATVDNAVIVAFNVRPAERVAEYADQEGVEIKYYSVIYQALEDIENALKGMLKPIYEEVELGTAEIQQVFRSSKFGNIAGCLVRKGTIKRGTKARLVRDGVVVADNLEIQSLRREKDDVTEVREGFECGINLGFKDIQTGDRIETWEMREKPRE